jgi:deoxyribonuclease-4
MIFGAHISLSNGLLATIDLALEIGATSMQFFSGNPRGWKTDKYKQDEAEEFKKRSKREGLGPVFLHSPYLINLGSPNPYIYTNSITNLGIALEKASQIEAQGVITHLGSAKGKQSRGEGVDRVVEGIGQILKSTSANLILESSAGAGEIIGDRIEELAEIIKKVDSSRLGVCLDTAHLFASGYDLRDENKLNSFLADFDKLIGFDKLKVFHLNDSKGKLGSNLDRHANIGKGNIGKQAFKNLVNHEAIKYLPGIIETPKIDKDDHNLKLLRKLSNE